TSNQLRAVAITRVLNGESAASVARAMEVDRSTVCRWLPKADAIVEVVCRPPLLPRATEKRLLDWLRQMRTVRYLCVSLTIRRVIHKGTSKRSDTKSVADHFGQV
ncbi:TPA: hypothetical protein N0F65_011514, partial [Lagenidium giganteum]